jgi:ABC-2 type transport system permease protein
MLRNVWLVATHEYTKIVKQKSFLLSTFAMPVIIAVITFVGIFVAVGQRGKLPLGYVDNADVLAEAVMPIRDEDEPMVALRAFPDTDSARAALYDKHIQAYYVLPTDYATTGKVEMFYLTKRPTEVVQEDFRDFLLANLLIGQSDSIQRRLQLSPDLTIEAMDGSREFETENLLNFFLPFLAAFFFVFAVMGSGSYMLQAVTEEKENRTIEILSTSIRPIELIGGKALGLMSVSLTQLGIWAATAAAGLLIWSRFVDLFSGLTVPWSLLAVVAVFFFPAYALIAAMMTAIGSAVTDMRQGQQIAGILNMLFTFPFFLMALIMAKPNHPIAVVLTLFPTTSFITITLRWAATTVPLWQLLTSWVLVVSAAAASIWIAARIFRLGMLRYGQSLSLKSVFTSRER